MTNNLDNLYDFVIVEDEDYNNIRILRGDLEGAVIKVGKVSLDEENETLSFNFDFVKPPLSLPDFKVQEKIIGDIVVDIIEKHLITGE